MQYWIVKPIVNGFETALLMFGTETELVKYLQERIKMPSSYTSIPYDTVLVFEQFGFKVYCLPAERAVSENMEDS